MKHGIQKKGNERESIGNNDMATKEIMVTQLFFGPKVGLEITRLR